MGRSTELGITPLGAAIVEALPDRARIARIKRRFSDGFCPASAVFDADGIRRFYAALGQRVKPVDRGVK